MKLHGSRAGAVVLPLWCMLLIILLPYGAGLKMQVNSGAEECFSVLLDEDRIAVCFYGASKCPMTIKIISSSEMLHLAVCNPPVACFKSSLAAEKRGGV